jgi:hypothetical protein
MLPAFLVCEFAKETLSNLVRERFGDDFPNIITKRQTAFIYNYLSDLGAETILLESEYVDRDYLEDYARYYVKCFNRYGERCARLHFFKKQFNHTEFFNYLNDNDSSEHDSLRENYLGFMVIKPLPKTFIGKTCLKLYPSFEDSNTKKAIKIEHTVNLFGIPLYIKSVAFQEQDKVLSACATTAIWSTLHAQDNNDYRKVNSCSEITLSAINHVVDSSNSFPNKGLTNKQILRALDIQGYRNHKIDIRNDSTVDTFFDIVKTHIDSNIPIILGADVYKYLDNQLIKLDGHAVSILGYKDSGKEKAIYIHDDRLGPFAKATLTTPEKLFPELVSTEDEENIDNKFLSSWCISLQDKENHEWCKPEEIMFPDSLIIATHPKIRISSEYIENTCLFISDELTVYSECLLDAGGLETQDLSSFTYKIQSTNLSDFRNRIRNSKTIVNKADILTKNMARFLWSAIFYDSDKHEVFEVIFDATDIPQGNAIVAIIEYEEGSRDYLGEHFLNLPVKQHVNFESPKNFFRSFVRCLEKKDAGYLDFLDDNYGQPRAPKRLNDAEVHNGSLQIQSGLIRHYGRTVKSLIDDFKDLIVDDNDSFRIWVISFDGALLIGKEVGSKGHPTLAGFSSARIAGELRRTKMGWSINAKSGRYSSTYENSNDLLENAKGRFLEIYSNEKVLNTLPFDR